MSRGLGDVYKRQSLYGAQMGVDILRVHDIDEHNDFFKVYYGLTN